MYFKLYLPKAGCPKNTNRYNCALFTEFANNPDIKIVANTRAPRTKQPARQIHGDVKDGIQIFKNILKICMECHQKYEK